MTCLCIHFCACLQPQVFEGVRYAQSSSTNVTSHEKRALLMDTQHVLGVVLGSGEKLSELSPEGQQPFKPQGWAATAAPLQAVTSTHQVWAVQKYLTRTKSHVNMLVRGVTTEPTCWYAVTTAPTCWYGVTTAPTCWCTVSPRHQQLTSRYVDKHCMP